MESHDSFDELANCLQSRDLIKDLCNILISYFLINLSSAELYKKSKLFLSAYLIYRFPHDVLGNISEFNQGGVATRLPLTELSSLVFEAATELVKYASTDSSESSPSFNPHDFGRLYEEFIKTFDLWKADDVDKLKNTLIQEYHQISVQCMNIRDDILSLQKNLDETHDSNSVERLNKSIESSNAQIVALEHCQNNLLDSAKMIGGNDFANTILQYSPVVIDLDELAKTYSTAFWNVLSEEHAENKYDKVFLVLEHIKILFTELYNSENSKDLIEINEKIDIPFIKQRLDHNIYGSSEMFALCRFIMEKCKQLQAPTFDAHLEILEHHLETENFLPPFLHEIFLILQITVTDTVELRSTIAKTTPDVSE